MNRSLKVTITIVSLAVALSGTIAAAKTISVPKDRLTIQAAIDAAVDGDVVVVAKGTYRECIDFEGKAITVCSTDPTDESVVAATIIEGDKKGSVVTFRSGEKTTSILSGFTITNGSGTPRDFGASGGGMYCLGSSPTICNNLITGNSAAFGGGVYCDKSSAVLTENAVNGNAAKYGGGVYCEHSSPSLTSNTIDGNEAQRWGGGVFCENDSSPTIANNTITGNLAIGQSGSGGGVACGNRSSPTIINNTISGNQATGPDGSGGGVHCWYSSPTLTGNTISGNSADFGGGVHCHHSSPPLTANTITGNLGNLEGGGVYCFSSSSILTGNTISDNMAMGRIGSGGGVYCWQSALLLSSNTISGNKAKTTGGGLHCTGSSEPVLTGNTISDNWANRGGGAYFRSKSGTMINNTISRNVATGPDGCGGGVCCEGLSPPTLTSNTISGNRAGSDGGGVYCANSPATITNNTITRNKATRGGGVYCHYCSPALSNNAMRGNKADRGGGVYCYFSSPHLTNNTISRNIAVDGGGVCCYGSSPTLRNTIVFLNTTGGGVYVETGSGHPDQPVLTYCDLWGNIGGDYVNFPNQTGKNGNISLNPLVAGPAKGDFHLRSTGGRWDPRTKTWVVDTVHSPCIDAGDPKSAFDREPAPNGGRINMGAEGNTPEASKSARAG